MSIPIKEQVKTAMKNAIEHFQKELKGLRTSRANPSVLDGVFVEVYGTKMRLKDLANVTVPESRQLLVTPFDPSNTNSIGKGIENANLSLRPIVEANIIRINIPPMDEKQRKEIAKECKKKAEDAKVAIREIRRKYNDLIRKQKQDGELPEDVMRKLENEIQKLTDDCCKDIDQISVKKSEEILEI